MAVPSVRRPSAAFVMGWMSGAFVAISFLPTAFPVIYQLITAEQTLGLRTAVAAAYSIHAQVATGDVPSAAALAGLSIHHLTIRTSSGTTALGAPLPAVQLDDVCAKGSDLVESDRETWAMACVDRGGIRTVAGVHLDATGAALRVVELVLLLALFVGIVTSLGILRLLRPLSEMSAALARVGAGERGVIVTQTGLAELDALVDRLNAAARSVDDREDAILARIAVVQEMARIVAHEIRNPLQSLELLTSLIAAEDDPTERKDIGDSIHTEIRTLEQVVHRLLTESAARGALRLQITVQPIATLVQQVVALRRPQATSSGAVLRAGNLTWVEVAFDQALIKRSIENLVLNALQAVPRGTGEIRVSLRDELDHGQIVIVVEDNGPGVPEGLEDHIFEANVSGRGGTGLGLALVKGVIEAHGGTIVYSRSEQLGGARFDARLPITQSPAGEDD